MALTKGISKWWGNTSNPVQSKGDIFTVSWGEPWYQFKVIEFDSFNSITWECIDANQIIPGLKGVKKEWVGTKLEWIISPVNNGKVEVSLIHHGLTSEITCYEFCSAAWDGFVTNSMKNYLEGLNSQISK
ncbi:hypothetical protein [Aquimarina macrocephali]|uniref:hypothetical protein n=1 Tax=Aquimarina macrocephali TaxID=666563 RepID=UPI0004AD642D|nr:hypothetical protein [Aquimarina macrocephali]